MGLERQVKPCLCLCDTPRLVWERGKALKGRPRPRGILNPTLGVQEGFLEEVTPPPRPPPKKWMTPSFVKQFLHLASEIGHPPDFPPSISQSFFLVPSLGLLTLLVNHKVPSARLIFSASLCDLTLLSSFPGSIGSSHTALSLLTLTKLVNALRAFAYAIPFAWTTFPLFLL